MNSSHADEPAARQRSLLDYRRIVLLTDGHSNPFVGKTAICMLRYRADDVVAILDRSEAGKTAGDLFCVGGDIPVIESFDDVAYPDGLFLGIAPPGGRLPDHWVPIIKDALKRRIDIVSGLHHFLSRDSELSRLAQQTGGSLIDLRRNDESETASGSLLSGPAYRVLTVGQDCSVGKMVTSVELQREFLRRGVECGFAATGQTGIMISGGGVPIDSVVSDFVNGAAQRLVHCHRDKEVVVVEGQGSISHPAYSAVTVGLLHGVAPHAMILCYEAGREGVKGFGDLPLRSLKELVTLYESMAKCRWPARVVGVAVNSRKLDEPQFEEEKTRVFEELGLPVCDVIREGPATLVDALEAERKRHNGTVG